MCLKLFILLFKVYRIWIVLEIYNSKKNSNLITTTTSNSNKDKTPNSTNDNKLQKKDNNKTIVLDQKKDGKS